MKEEMPIKLSPNERIKRTMMCFFGGDAPKPTPPPPPPPIPSKTIASKIGSAMNLVKSRRGRRSTIAGGLLSETRDTVKKTLLGG